MRNSIIGFYCFLLSKRNIISFLAGIIVSGYVVEISILQNLNKWHLFTIIIGIVIGLCCLILVRISENFEDNTKAFKKNSPEKSFNQINIDAWSSINTNSNANKVLKLLPKIWLPLTTLSLPSLFVIGVLLLNYANIEIKKESLNESQVESSKLVNQVDSVLKIQYDKLLKNEELNDSIDILNHKISFQSKQIDSLIKIQQSGHKLKNSQ